MESAIENDLHRVASDFSVVEDDTMEVRVELPDVDHAFTLSVRESDEVHEALLKMFKAQAYWHEDWLLKAVALGEVFVDVEDSFGDQGIEVISKQTMTAVMKRQGIL